MLIHANGPAGGLFINPAVVNNPASVPLGWAFGLDIPLPLFIQQLTFPFPGVFLGTLTGGGSSLSLGVPPGLQISIVAVHFSATTNLPLFSSFPVTYTTI
jgi:hypothetical protein